MVRDGSKPPSRGRMGGGWPVGDPHRTQHRTQVNLERPFASHMLLQLPKERPAGGLQNGPGGGSQMQAALNQGQGSPQAGMIVLQLPGCIRSRGSRKMVRMLFTAHR